MNGSACGEDLREPRELDGGEPACDRLAPQAVDDERNQELPLETKQRDRVAGDHLASHGYEASVALFSWENVRKVHATSTSDSTMLSDRYHGL